MAHITEYQAVRPPDWDPPADGPLPFCTNSSQAGSFTASGQIRVLAGPDEALTVFQTGLLLAKNLRATLHLAILEEPEIEVHFGSTRCYNLLLGLMDSVRRQLREEASRSGGEFAVEIRTLSAGRSILIQVRNAAAVPQRECVR